MVLIQHLYGIPSLRQTHQRIQDTLSYRWFLGYGLLETIPHFATVSYAFCKRFPEELTEEMFCAYLEGKRTYRSNTRHCKGCSFKALCGANEKGQKLLTTHIWQEYLDLVEQLRRTERGKEIYAMRKETIERVFADAKEKHAMRYTHHRGLARVTNWVRLKYVAMNLKKLAEWSWKDSFLPNFFSLFSAFYAEVPAFA